MRIVDIHTHLVSPSLIADDPLTLALRTGYDLVRPRLPAGARAALELAAGAALPLHRRLRDGALALADRAVALSRNRFASLGRLGEMVVGGAGPLALAGFLRATPQRLLEDLDDAGIAAAVVLPVPPGSSTDEVLALRRSPKAAAERLIPFCCPTPSMPDPGARVAAWKAQGCRGIKVHPTIHKRPVDDPFYREVADIALAHDLPILAHTGCVHVMGGDRRHEAFSRAGAYEPLIRDFPRVRFVLAHMNFFHPDEAIDLAVRHENVLLDTSWQPAATIRRAFRRLGASRLLFGSDWPFLGTSLGAALEIVARGVERRPDALERVLGRNALELLKMG